jgi:adenylate cyclase
MEIRETKLVLVSADLAGYTRCAAALDAMSVARFLDAWYRACAIIIRQHSGRVIKFIGDGVLAVFPEERAVDAVDACEQMIEAVRAMRGEHGMKVELGANVHVAVVAEGDYGPDDDRRYDVLGSGVNHLFLMGGAAGIRISEPVYRSLPNERRGPWAKYRPPATYTLRV